jgi:hypothetical protein
MAAHKFLEAEATVEIMQEGEEEEMKEEEGGEDDDDEEEEEEGVENKHAKTLLDIAEVLNESDLNDHVLQKGKTAAAGVVAQESVGMEGVGMAKTASAMLSAKAAAVLLRGRVEQIKKEEAAVEDTPFGRMLLRLLEMNTAVDGAFAGLLRTGNGGSTGVSGPSTKYGISEVGAPTIRSAPCPPSSGVAGWSRRRIVEYFSRKMRYREHKLGDELYQTGDAVRYKGSGSHHDAIFLIISGEVALLEADPQQQQQQQQQHCQGLLVQCQQHWVLSEVQLGAAVPPPPSSERRAPRVLPQLPSR